MKPKKWTSFITAMAVSLSMFVGVVYVLAPSLPSLTLPEPAPSTVLADDAAIANTVAEDFSTFTKAVEEVADSRAVVVESSYRASETARNIQTLFDEATPDVTKSATVSSTPHYVRTLVMNDIAIPYVYSFNSRTAPESTAGLWLGSDSTTDGSWGYFIGHNPGIFAPMLKLGYKSPVTVWDSNGKSRTYHIVEIFDVPNTTKWNEVSGHLTSRGESIALQTCIFNGLRYRIAIAI